MLYVWITSYLFTAVVGGILALCAAYFTIIRWEKRTQSKTKNPTDVEPLSEPMIPPSGPILT